MAITVEHGSGEAELGLAQLAADKIQAEKDQARSDAMFIEAQNIALREKQFQATLASREYEFNKGLEMEKFKIDLGFEKEQRAQMWELEKMETRSRLDFERDERSRQGKLDKYDAAVKSIEERDDLDREEKENFLFMAEMKYLGQERIAQASMQEDKGQSMLDQLGLLDQPETEIQQHIETVADKQEVQQMMSTVPETEQGFEQIVKGLTERDPAQAQAYYLEHRKKFMQPEEADKVAAEETATRTEIDEKRQDMLAYPEFLEKKGMKDSEYQWKRYRKYAQAHMNGEKEVANRIVQGMGSLSSSPSQVMRQLRR